MTFNGRPTKKNSKKDTKGVHRWNFYRSVAEMIRLCPIRYPRLSILFSSCSCLCRSRRRRRRRRCPLTTRLVIKKSLSTVASDSYNFPVTGSDHNSSEFLARGTMRNERQWYYFVLISLFVRRGPPFRPNGNIHCNAPRASRHCRAFVKLPLLDRLFSSSAQSCAPSTGAHSPSAPT